LRSIKNAVGWPIVGAIENYSGLVLTRSSSAQGL